jgi:crotonobetaine/carnitine-CoA ligase
MAEVKWDTVTAVLRRAVERFGTRTFLDFGGVLHSYAAVDHQADRFANGLLAAGVRRGDRVCTLLNTSMDAVVAWIATNKIGAIYVPINSAYKGEYLRHQVTDAGARIALVEQEYLSRFDLIAQDLPGLELLVVRRDPDAASGDASMGKPVVMLEEFLGSDASVPDENRFSDIAMIIYTGGTTGPSKGCIVSHNYACNLARQFVENGKRTAEDINWSPLPLFHLNALCSTILSSAMVGARASLYPRFSVTHFWPEVERSGATIVNLLGSMLNYIAEQPDTETSRRCYGRLRAVRGSPFPAPLQEKWQSRFGVQKTGSNVYGLTEACSVTTLSDDEFAKPGSSGKRNEDFDVIIADDNDVELPPNSIGEILIRPRRPHIMFEGYWNRPEETLRVLNNLWLHSGDLGKFDEDGFFYFVDRKKDYLRRRGENISSFELETAFRKHPQVEDVAVHSVLSDTAEDDVKATIVLKAGSYSAQITPEMICVWAAERVPYFAVPRYIEFRTDLPRNPVGRVLKYVLREEGCTPTTWDREKASFRLEKR